MSKKDLAIKSVQLPVPVESIEAYVQRVNQIPMLSLEEEQELGRRLRDENDLQAAQKLILSHLRYVAKVAKSYMGYGLQLGDLIQEGTVGLMKAVKRFDPDKGVRLVSFAVHWIKAEMHEFILKNWRIVKVATTKAQRKLFFNLKSQKSRLGWCSQEEIAAIAKDLGVKPEEVVQMEQRLSSSDISFDLPEEDDALDTTFSPSAYLEAPDPSPEHALVVDNWQAKMGENFHEAFLQLESRHKDIIEKRWFGEHKVTLKELSKQYGISVERVRQVEQQALAKLKTFMQKDTEAEII